MTAHMVSLIHDRKYRTGATNGCRPRTRDLFYVTPNTPEPLLEPSHAVVVMPVAPAVAGL
jgi:hypothetical protein